MAERNPRPSDYSHDSDLTNKWSNFELSEYLEFDDNHWLDDDPEESLASEQVPNQVFQANEVGDFGGSGNNFEGSSRTIDKSIKEARERVAFKTKSEVEILNDGFKWRKYGKKMVKNSRNPRNYYKCSVEGCPVKKRVERDNNDSRYVITTYDGIHTHPNTC